MMSLSISQFAREPQRVLRIARWVLSPILCLMVLSYEVWEHILSDRESPFDPHFASEILLFGFVGPILVFLALSYIHHLLEAQAAARTELEALNRDLEAKVAERTAALEMRNAELARANAELQQLDRLKSDFVSLVSHELRAPLTTINGGLELIMQSAGELPPAVCRRLDILSGESARLTQLVQTILDLSRLEAGRLKLNAGLVALQPMLARAVETTAPGRNVHVEIPPSLPPAWADETYVEQVARNLISNAAKYTPHERPIHIGAQLAEGALAVWVADHGPGIPLDEQERVFGRFYRIPNSEQADAPGWGLGLYFARKLIEAHGGQMRLESPAWPDDAQYPGTRFTFTLPMVCEESNEAD